MYGIGPSFEKFRSSGMMPNTNPKARFNHPGMMQGQGMSMPRTSFFNNPNAMPQLGQGINRVAGLMRQRQNNPNTMGGQPMFGVGPSQGYLSQLLMNSPMRDRVRTFR